MMTIALVGDRSPGVRAHTRIPVLFDALRERADIDVYWVPTDAVPDLSKFDGIWMVPGSPYRHPEGAIEAARIARTEGIPFLGTCGGFQHALLEFARNACGFPGARHAEYAPAGDDELIVELACSLAGHEAAIDLVPGSLIERLLGAARTVERYHCDYGLSTAHLGLLQEHGLRFTGHDADGEVRVAELPGHPFYLTTLFQPELSGGTDPHPVIRGFVEAAARQSV
jgi:CTP synthase (UTP-ammonia lyase)